MDVVTTEVDVVEAFTRHRASLTRLARLLVDDLATAEDVVQDAFVGLHRRRHDLRDQPALLTYLRRSVVHHAQNVQRHRAVVRRTPPPYLPPGASADEALVLDEEQRAVLEAVRRLPARQRAVVVLRYWSGLSEAEIAATLEISRGAVKSQASRALDKVQSMLEAPGGVLATMEEER